MALRCADSITSMLSFVLGFHITVLYSSIDRARVMYAIVLVLMGASNPKVAYN